jgi:hypothetical protein
VSYHELRDNVFADCLGVETKVRVELSPLAKKVKPYSEIENSTRRLVSRRSDKIYVSRETSPGVVDARTTTSPSGCASATVTYKDAAEPR